MILRFFLKFHAILKCVSAKFLIFNVLYFLAVKLKLSFMLFLERIIVHDFILKLSEHEVSFYIMIISLL